MRIFACRLHDNILNAIQPNAKIPNAIIPNMPIYPMPKYPIPIYPIVKITIITLMLTLIKNAHSFCVQRRIVNA